MLPLTWAMPAVITHISSDCVILLRKGRMVSGRLGLAHEDRRRHVQALGPARAHEPRHHLRHRLHDHLHDPEVVEDREERGHEDDRGQDLEREHEADAPPCRWPRRPSPGGCPPPWMPSAPKTKLGAHVREVQEPGDLPADPGEDLLADRRLQDEEGEARTAARGPTGSCGAGWPGGSWTGPRRSRGRRGDRRGTSGVP